MITKPTDGESAADVQARKDAAFAAALETHRRELRLHSYRMMGSLHEAEDLLQESMMRAWAARDRYEGRAPLRAWLIRIATNACLDALERRSKQCRHLSVSGISPSTEMPTGEPMADLAWLEPVPGSWIDEAADPSAGPEAMLATRQSVRLAFMAALQALPPRQRAAIVLKEVLGWTAAEIADLLGIGVSAVNSGLQRARKRIPLDEPRAASSVETQLVERYLRAWEERRLDDLVALLSEDATLRMPPWAQWYCGSASIKDFLAEAWSQYDGFEARKTEASGQPAVLIYAHDRTAGRLKPHSLHVLTCRDNRIIEIVGYVGQLGRHLVPLFAL